ncbi:MAG TPA: hypothetical protein VJQ82_17160 [Terriglobales bacterium]|nr:hypothetical protein [Terriglobales bacterium]
MAKSPMPSLRSAWAASLSFIQPMLAVAVSAIPEGSQWQYEIKLDGYRAIVVKTDPVTVFSRRSHDFSLRFRSISSALSNLPNDKIVDGEVVAPDSDGGPNFNALQNALRDIQPFSMPSVFWRIEVRT